MTKKETIVHYFSQMDIEMLELLLDNTKTYQEATKETFLKKLNENVFREFKNNGDAELTSIKGACDADNCNKGCTGFLFLGKASNNYSAFIFEETQGEIHDIYHCRNFKCDEITEELNNSFSFTVAIDEEANFEPSIDYLIQVQQSEKAYSEIAKEDFSYLHKEDYLPWLKTHKDLYDSLPSIFQDYKKIHNFKWLYYRLNELANFLVYEQDAEQILKNFESINANSESELLGWLVENEILVNNLGLLRLGYITEEEVMQEEYTSLSKDYNIKIAVVDYKNVIQLADIYFQYYWEMLAKYYSYLNEDEFENDTNANDSEKRRSLNYHLQRRKNAALLGIDYPLYIYGKNE